MMRNATENMRSAAIGANMNRSKFEYIPVEGSRSAEWRLMLTSRICESDSRLLRPRFLSRSTLALRSSLSALDGRLVPGP
jgi:hypothetical protein